MTVQLIKNFENPVQSSQVVFRKVLSALSEPGIWQTLPKCETLPEFEPSTMSVLLTLLDADTTLWLVDSKRSEAVKTNLIFHCGCQLTEDKNAAQFAIYDLADFLADDQLAFSMGNDRYPDLSATIIVQIPESSESLNVVWSGPGIENARECQLPLPKEFWEKRDALIEFPRGIDFIFTQGDRVLGLPRSTRITIEEMSECM